MRFRKHFRNSGADSLVQNFGAFHTILSHSVCRKSGFRFSVCKRVKTKPGQDSGFSEPLSCPELIVSGAVGDGRMAQDKRRRRQYWSDGFAIALPGKDVEDHVGGMDALGQGLCAGCLHRGQSVRQDAGQNGDHLAIAIIAPGQLAPHPLEGRRQDPLLEWRPIAQRAGFARQNRHVMPGIVNRLAAAIAAGMLADDAPVLANDDAISVSLHVSFMAYDLGYIDLEQKTLQTINNPFAPKVSPMSQVQSVTYVSGLYHV